MRFCSGDVPIFAQPMRHEPPQPATTSDRQNDPHPDQRALLTNPGYWWTLIFYGQQTLQPLAIVPGHQDRPEPGYERSQIRHGAFQYEHLGYSHRHAGPRFYCA